MRPRSQLGGPIRVAHGCPECDKGGDYDSEQIRVVQSVTVGLELAETNMGRLQSRGPREGQISCIWCSVM